MRKQESEQDEENELAIRLAQGEQLSLPVMLRFFHLREKTLSGQLQAGDSNAYQPLESIRAQIADVQKQITASGPIRPLNGESSIRNTHNTPH